jgi:hypothetical protein
LSVNGKPDSTVIRPAFRSYSLQLSYRGWCPNRSFNEEVISITKYLGSEGLWCQFPWTPITFSVAICCYTPCGWSLFFFFFFFFWSNEALFHKQVHNAMWLKFEWPSYTHSAEIAHNQWSQVITLSYVLWSQVKK